MTLIEQYRIINHFLDHVGFAFFLAGLQYGDKKRHS